VDRSWFSNFGRGFRGSRYVVSSRGLLLLRSGMCGVSNPQQGGDYSMFIWLTIYLVVIIAGIALLLPLYNKLLKDLERHNEEVFDRLGRPTLFMASPRRSIGLQKFIYVGRSEPGIHPSVVRQCRILGIMTPLFVLLVICIFAWGMVYVIPT